MNHEIITYPPSNLEPGTLNFHSTIFGLLFLIGLFQSCQTEPSRVNASLAVADALSSDTTGYLRADKIRPFDFPTDYGPHPGFKTEWWYYTGNLETQDGEHFGYQFTIFRFALTPPDSTPPARDSDWATNQLFMAHFALTDVEGKQFYAFERFSRGAAGLAGAQADPYRIWLEDWSVESGESSFPMHIRAAQEGVAIDLTLTTSLPAVLQGERGLDQKGPEPGNASYYYSFPRLQTEGTIAVRGKTFAVQGLSWKDHEWSTSALSEDQVGWDWFSLQLSNEQSLMYYQLRRHDGTPSPFTSGVLVEPDGTTRPLGPGDVEIDVLDTWTSPRGGTYPARWQLRVLPADINLTITPYLPDQELDVSVRYWEGAVRIEGTAAGTAVSGNGYVELTGYADGPRNVPGNT